MHLQAAIDFAELRKRSCGANGWAGTLSANPAYHIAAHHVAFFSASAFCKSAIDFAEAADAELWSWGRGVPRLSPRSPPRKFFYTCILQGAIDFAVMRMRCCGAWGGMLRVLRRGRLCT